MPKGKSARSTRSRTAGASLLSGLMGGERSREAGLTGSIRSLAGQMMDFAGAAMDASLGAGALLVRDPKQRASLNRAGKFLRGVREGGGMTIADLSKAVDLKDPALLELAENGKAALPFEIILRLASVLSRNDPIPFVMNLTNAYSPGVGRMLTALGVGRLVEHAKREHDFINLYRSRDAARRLTDEQFAHVLTFIGAALDLALEYVAKAPTGKKGVAKGS